jgi:cobalt-zinc-cadmium efflux system outer membrane protein
LWDSFYSLNSYRSTSALLSSRQADEDNAKVQIRLAVRAAYVQVQLALEELRLVSAGLDLARAQQRDVVSRFNAGAAAKLDLLTSNRQSLAYELQFKQKQAELSAYLKTLLALVGLEGVDASRPGPKGVEDVLLVLELDKLKDTVAAQSPKNIPAPDENQPQIRGQEYLAQSSQFSAESQKAKLWPIVQISAGTALAYPNGPIPEQINQNTVALSLTMPLFLGDPTGHQVAAKLQDAEAAKYRKAQLQTDLNRDFSKSKELLASLLEQRALAVKDVAQSQEAAQLYYSSYQAGKINLIDVQTADNLALQAKVGAARIDAQILLQLFTLKALSGKEV